MIYIYCISLLTLLIFLLFLKQKPSREAVFYLTDSLEGVYYYYIIIIIFCSLYLVYSLLGIKVFSKYLVYVHNTTSPKALSITSELTSLLTKLHPHVIALKAFHPNPTTNPFLDGLKSPQSFR